MKRLTAILLCLLMMLALVACNSGETPTEAPTEAPTAAPTDAPTEAPKPTDPPEEVEWDDVLLDFTEESELYRTVGRTQRVDKGIACDFTASGIELYGYFYNDMYLRVSCTKDTYFSVVIDGEPQAKRYMATSGESEITLEGFEDQAKHTVQILKQTEPQWSLCVFKELELYGDLSVPVQKDYLIEFLGDSITCGYGNLWTSSATHASKDAGISLYEDGVQAYACAAARELGADWSVIGCSGIGIDKGWPSFNMQDFYTKQSRFRNSTAAYTVERKADVVVINLGTNDAGRGSTEAQLIANVKTLIATARSYNGEDTPIVWAHNMMGECRFDWVKKAIDELGGESAGIYVLKLDQNNAGGNGHPTLKAQSSAASKLAAFIEDKELLK